jgi:hypothetical protein
MGHHYVPQGYLRAFESKPDSGLIWMYDRKTGHGAQVPIKVVAQSPDYYEEDVEQQLSAVEGPAHTALRRVLQDRAITAEDRHTLAYYIAVLMYRVPRRRRKGEEMIPEILEDTIRSVQNEIDEWAASRPAADPLVERRRAEVQAVATKYRITPPNAVQDQLRTPWPSAKVFELITRKVWRLVFTTTVDRFVTCDNPAFFFEGLGLGNPDSEMTFPLSPDLALLADWQGTPFSTSVFGAKPGLVREVNRRLVSGAERFIFSHVSQPWVPSVARKKHPYLSRIQWRQPEGSRARGSR